MIKRNISEKCLSLASQFPVLAITGPRQSGKTTLAKTLFPNKKYINLEELDQRSFAIEDPRGFLAQLPEGAIIDEIQRAPDLLSYIQSIVDQNNTKGFFILTGSHQFELLQSINQSLAGRTALVKLMPFSLKELPSNKLGLNEQMLTGFYPRIYQDKLEPYDFYANYFETYVEKDVRNISNIQDLHLFSKFVRLLAGQIGQLVNYESIANALGISQPIIKKWISILEASFIVFLLPPYYANIKKRLIKTAKLYFIDAGLAAYLLGIESEDQLQYHPLRGNMFENMIISEYLKQRLNQGKTPNLFFYRENTGLEVDLLLEEANSLKAFEIKSAETPNIIFADNIQKMADVLDKKISAKTVIMGSDSINNKLHDVDFISWRDLEGDHR